MKVLIIGATGSTGQVLLDKALEQGHRVTALARNPSAVAPRDEIRATPSTWTPTATEWLTIAS